MCGFAGLIEKAPGAAADPEGFLRGMGAALAHRGPNDEGFFRGPGFAVVHRRLSIIDLAHGHQPMTLEEGRVGIAYNGEVYNFRELRRELQAAGHRFRTDCDTEVVLHWYAEHGVAGFDRLNGMFAAFIWDCRGPRPEFHLVRDHLGTKPLYLYEDGRFILFASEISPLLRVEGLDLSLDPEGLQSYLTFRYTQAPLTFYRRIRRVEAGTYVTVREGRRLAPLRYWDLPVPAAHIQLDAAEAAAGLHDLLLESVKEQQVSDVPVGLLLSGGLDSSVIACLCAENGVSLKSFNIGFPDLNEFRYSQIVADRFGLPHVTVETTPEEMCGRFEQVVRAVDEPIADPACLPLRVLCEEIAKDVTVVLSGEGSDETLAGYPQYARVLESGPSEQAAHFERFLEHSHYYPHGSSVLRSSPPRSRTWLQRPYFMENNLLPGMLAFDLKTWLPENLMMKADKVLMSRSLEGRFPFLGRKVVEYACALPDHLKLQDGAGKHLLRQAFGGRLPEQVIRRPKMGFSVPVPEMVARFRERFFDLLGGLRSHPLAEVLDLDRVHAEAQAYYSTGLGGALRVWTLLVLLQWFSDRSPASRGAIPL